MSRKSCGKAVIVEYIHVRLRFPLAARMTQFPYLEGLLRVGLGQLDHRSLLQMIELLVGTWTRLEIPQTEKSQFFIIVQSQSILQPSNDGERG